MSPQSANSVRRGVRWLLPAALLAGAPKCVLCLLAYAGLGTFLGFGGPEFCGSPNDPTPRWVTSLAWAAVIPGLVGVMAHLLQLRTGPRATPNPKQRPNQCTPK